MPVAVKWLIVVLIAALPVGLIMSGAFDQETETVVYPPSRHDVIFFAKEIVKKGLREPETAIFQEDDQMQVETLAENQWRVAGYVDAKSGVRSKADVLTTARYPFA